MINGRSYIIGSWTYLDVREVGPYNTIHDTPDVCNRILVDDFDSELFTDKTPCSLSTEEVFGPYNLGLLGFRLLERDLDGVFRVLDVVLETSDRPWPLNSASIGLDILDEDTLDHPLVQESCEWVSGIDELRATGPCASTLNTLGRRIPEGDLIDLGRLVSHDAWLQSHVLEEFQGPRLYAVCSASRRGLGAIVDMLDLVSPSLKACGKEKSNRSCADNDDVELFRG